MYDNIKKSKKPVKIFLKKSVNTSKKISNIKEDETEYKDNQPKNNISPEENKDKEIHENNLKEIEKLEQELNDLEKQNDLIVKEISIYRNTQKDLIEKKSKINNEVDNENNELEELKETNLQKNREYLQLLHLRHQQIHRQHSIENSNESQRSQQNNTSINNTENENNENNDVDRMADMFNGLNFLLNISRLRRAQYGDDEDSINVTNEEHNNEGPPMTHEQIQALPSSSYPRNNNSNEKCVICDFDFCYNDIVTRLRCNHTFHKNCLVNRLTATNSSKCPTCKTSLI